MPALINLILGYGLADEHGVQPQAGSVRDDIDTPGDAHRQIYNLGVYAGGNSVGVANAARTLLGREIRCSKQ